jgi:hypothetical protein
MNHTAPETGVFVALLADENLQVAVDPDGVLVIYPRGDEAVALQVRPAQTALLLDKIAAALASRGNSQATVVPIARAADIPSRIATLRASGLTLVGQLSALGTVNVSPRTQIGGTVVSFEAWIAGLAVDGGPDGPRGVSGSGAREVDALLDLLNRLKAADRIISPLLGACRWSPTRRAFLPAWLKSSNIPTASTST